MNTRNVNNVSIEVDHNLVRNEHNKRLCEYLKDEQAYNKYLLPVLKQQANEDLYKIQNMFMPHNNKEALKSLWHSLKGRKPASKDELYFMLKNDLKRNRLVRLNK